MARRGDDCDTVGAGDAAHDAEAGTGRVQGRQEIASQAERADQVVVPLVGAGVEELRGAGVGHVVRRARAQLVVHEVGHHQERGGPLVVGLPRWASSWYAVLKGRNWMPVAL